MTNLHLAAVRRARLATDNSNTLQHSATALFDRPQTGERAVLVQVDFGQANIEEDIEELSSLAISAGADPVALLTAKRNAPDARIFIGKGKLEELKTTVKLAEADIVLFNHSLSPSQERNLEKELQCRVLDRAGLILDIFAQRARTFEGKLQVELAQLRHISTRLVRGWTHLERQKGGIGLRGPGETQLETDRRLLGIRIKQLRKKLEKVRKQRDQGRQSRLKHDLPTVALVGYTNAGKSTLFNFITESDVYVADQLFATLDPTLRKIPLNETDSVILADTVGFISQLPHELVAAFRATLEETKMANLLIHVVDANDEMRNERVQQVNEVLTEIGANKIPQLMVMNKIDTMNMAARKDVDELGKSNMVWLSAKTGEGIDLLKEALTEHLGQEKVHGEITLTPVDGRIRAKLFALDAVSEEKILEDGSSVLTIMTSKKSYNQLCKEIGVELQLQ